MGQPAWDYYDYDGGDLPILETCSKNADNIYEQLLTMDRDILASNMFTYGEMLEINAKLEKCRNIIAEVGVLCDNRLDT